MTEALKNPQFAHNLLAMAYQDLHAARHLHEGGFNPQAIFYLEQCVEKGLKSYSIASGLIDEKEVRREISHRTLKIYEKTWKDLQERVLKAQENLKNIPILEETIGSRMHFPEVIKEFDHSLDQLRTLLNQDEKSLLLTREELKKHIKILHDIHRDINQEKTRIQTKSVNPSKYRKIKQNLTAILEVMFANQPERLQVAMEDLNQNFTLDTYEKEKKNILLQKLPHNEIIQSFFELSIVLQPHAIARYPKSGFNPIEFYNPDLPLIKSFSKLADISERTLNQVDELYQKYDEVPSS